MFCRSVVFSNAPLFKAFRYRDVFQLVPFFYFKDAPFSRYAYHFPIFIEYKVDGGREEPLATESELRKRGIPEEVIKLGRKIPYQTRVRKEILNLLTALTNFHFFEYDSVCNCWGIQMPEKAIESLTNEEQDKYNNQKSNWIIRGYTYPKIAEDLKVSQLTECTEYYEASEDLWEYFTVNPELDSNHEIKIPVFLDSVIDNYYSLVTEERKVVRHCIGLLNEGIELFNTKRSVSLLSIVSSIEGMAKLDLNKYGKGEKNGPTERFIKYLKTYVARQSEEKYRLYYKKRCDITHEGVLFLGDVDLYGDLQQQNEDWLLRLEILQAARIAMFNWLRRKPKEKD